MAPPALPGGPSSCAAPNGGALRAFGTLTITGGQFENNVATQAGGAVYASQNATITGSASWSSDALAGGVEQMISAVDNTDCGPLAPADLTITGGVYRDGGAAPTGHNRLLNPAPLPGAVVTATTCVSGTWVAVTDDNGQYEIVLPGQVAEACDEIALEVMAQGHGAAERIYTVADLRTDPARDFVLEPWLYVWLPVIWQ